jgi:hypothetical protein
VLLAWLGVRALATTGSGFAATRGRRDGSMTRQAVEPATEHAAERREERTVGRSELGWLELAAQHAELVAQYGDLDVLGVRAAQAREQHADEPARHERVEGTGQLLRRAGRLCWSIPTVRPSSQADVILAVGEPVGSYGMSLARPL